MEEVFVVVERYFEQVVEWAVLLCEVIGVVIIVLTAVRGAIVLLRVIMAVIIHFEIRSEHQLLGDLAVEPKKEKKDRQPIIRL